MVVRPACVYGLQDPRDKLIWYIGMTANPKSRHLNHITVSKAGMVTERGQWLIELRNLGLKPTFIILDDRPEQIKAPMEKKFIAEYKQFRALKNSTKGGEGLLGFASIEETRVKMSTAALAVRKAGRSGHKYVTFDARWQKWNALYRINGKLQYISRFDSIEEAIAARDRVTADPSTLNEYKKDKSLGALRSPMRAHNTSGYRGVCLNRLKGTWVASITVNKKQIFLGAHKTAKEAAEARWAYEDAHALPSSRR